MRHLSGKSVKSVESDIRLASISRRFWCLCVIQVLTLNANAPVSDPKMATNAEVLAESQDVLMSLILWAYQKRPSTAEKPEESKAD